MKLRLVILTWPLLILMLGTTACSKEEDNIGSTTLPNSSITAEGVLTGKIENYTSGTLDYINSPDFSSATVSTDGKFQFIFPSVPSSLSKMSTSDYDQNNIVISDPSAQFYATRSESYAGYKNNVMIGLISKRNFDWTITCYWMYSTKAVTIKGTGSYSYDNSTSTEIDTDNLDITLEKGWNEVAYKESRGVKNNQPYCIHTITTVIPSDLKWYFQYR